MFSESKLSNFYYTYCLVLHLQTNKARREEEKIESSRKFLLIYRRYKKQNGGVECIYQILLVDHSTAIKFYSFLGEVSLLQHK